jgi:hypothetical protein
MKWFLLHPDGQRYGPADEAELQEWLDEGRAKRDTVVENSTTGEQMTLEAALGLAPEIVIPDISLQTETEEIQEDIAPVVTPLKWAEPEVDPTLPAEAPATPAEYEWPAPSEDEFTSEIGETPPLPVQTVEGSTEPREYGWPDQSEDEYKSEIGEIPAVPVDWSASSEPASKASDWPDGSETALRSEIGAPPPVESTPGYEWPSSPTVSGPPPFEQPVVISADSTEWTPKKGPDKMSKAPRTDYPNPPMAGTKPEKMVGLSVAITTIGFLLFCCVPGPLIGWAIAGAAHKRGAKGAKAAVFYAILMLIATIAFWIYAGNKEPTP